MDRQKIWQNTVDKFEQVVDKLGKGVDPGILEVVVGLNLNGINTTQSCEGHLNWGVATPWVDIGSADQIKLDQIFTKIKALRVKLKTHWGTDKAKKYSQQIADLDSQIIQINMAEATKVYKILEEFYSSRPTPYDQQLILIDHFTNTRIQSFGAMFQPIRSSKDKKIKLKTYQTEMTDFGKFLKNRYLR